MLNQNFIYYDQEPNLMGRTTLGSRTDDIEHISNKYQTN